MMAEDKYMNQSQQLALALVEHLAGAPLKRFAIGDLVAAMDRSRDQVFRALQNLAVAGWAQEHNGQWAIAPRITQLSDQVRLDIARLHEHYLLPVDGAAGGGQYTQWVTTRQRRG